MLLNRTPESNSLDIIIVCMILISDMPLNSYTPKVFVMNFSKLEGSEKCDKNQVQNKLVISIFPQVQFRPVLYYRYYTIILSVIKIPSQCDD